jgi:hypothetical protein
METAPEGIQGVMGDLRPAIVGDVYEVIAACEQRAGSAEALRIALELADEHRLTPAIKAYDDPDVGPGVLYLMLGAAVPVRELLNRIVDFKVQWYERCPGARAAGISVAADLNG